MHPVLERLTRLRYRECLVALSSGVCLGLAALLLLAVIAWGLDWTMDLPAGAVRMALTVLTLGGAAAVGTAAVRSGLRRTRSETAWALLIEQRHPASRGWISGAADFLARPPSDQGSARMAEATIARGEEFLGKLDPRDLGRLVDHRPLRVGLAAFAAAMGVVVAPFLLAPANTRVAAHRWALPWSERGWVRQTTLRWLDEDLRPLTDLALRQRVAAGESINLLLDEEQGKLPSDLRLTHVQPNGQTVDLPIRQANLQSGGTGRIVAVATLLPVSGSHEISARGGDDDRLPTLQLIAETAPVIEQFQITIRAPEYAGRPVDESRSSVAHVRALVGSTVTITGWASTPLARCRLMSEDGGGRDLPVAGDGLSFTAELPITRSGRTQFWFHVEDQNGLAHPRPPRYEALGDADATPTVTLDEPAADVRVTPQGHLAYRMSARDDLGIAASWLELRPLEVETADPPASHRLDLAPPETRDLNVMREGRWSLAELQLQPGRRFELQAVAVDGRPSEMEGREGRSPSRGVLIVSADEKRRQLASEEESLADELAALQSAVERDFGSLRELRAGWRAAREMPTDKVETLKQLADAAESIARRLGTSGSGWTGRLSQIMADREDNALADPGARERLDRIAEMSRQVAEELQPRISTEMRSVARSLSAVADRNSRDRNRISPDPDQAASIDESLARAEGDLRSSTETLDTAAGELASRNQRRDLRQALEEVIARQGELQQSTATAGRELLARPSGELTAEERGVVSTLAEKQRQVRELFSRLSEERQSAAAESQPGPEASPAWLQASSISELMLQASQKLDAFSLGGAMEAQQQLQELLVNLQREVQSSAQAGNSVQSIDQAEQLVRSLEKTQELWREHVDQLPGDPSTDSAVREAVQHLKAEQQAAADAMDELVRRLRRLAPKAVTPAAEAAQAIRRSSELLEDASPPVALQAAQTAGEKLRETAEQLADARQAAAQQEFLAAYEQTRSLAQVLADRQAGLREETARLHALAESEGRLSRSQLRTLNQLAADQRGLAGDVGQLDVQAPDDVARWVASTAVQLMQSSADRLGERHTGEDVQRLQQQAEQRLRMIASSAELTAPESAGESPPPAAEDGDDEQQQASGLSSLVPQLQLLRELQQDLIDRTRTLASRAKDDPAAAEERGRVAEEQQRVADLAAELLTGATERSSPSNEPAGDVPRLEQELTP